MRRRAATLLACLACASGCGSRAEPARIAAHAAAAGPVGTPHTRVAVAAGSAATAPKAEPRPRRPRPARAGAPIEYLPEDVVRVAGAGCVIRTRQADVSRIQVSPEGTPAFDVALVGAPTAIAPGPRAGAPVRVEVTGPLAFAGMASLPELGVARPVGYRGILRLGRAARLGSIRAVGDEAIGVASLGGLVEVGEVSVPCAALTANLAPPPSVVTPERGWEPVGPRLTVFPSATDEAGVPVEIRSVLLRKLGQSRRRVLVSAAFDDGSRLSGWVASNEVSELIGGGFGSGFGRIGSSGCGRVRPPMGPGDYFGPVRLQVGAPVFAEPERGEWARVTRSYVATGFHKRGDAWVELHGAPGIHDARPSFRCPTLSVAFVREASVRFEPDAKVQ